MGFWYIIYAVLLAALTKGLARRNDYEYQLRDKLFSNYSKDSQTRPVTVKLGVALSNLVSMDVQKEEVSLNIWFRLFWNDKRLSWNSSEYSNITQIRVLMQDIWTPDVFLYFATGQVQEFGKNIPGSLKFGAMLENDGALFYSQPTTIQATCEVDIAYYPFDDQFCKLNFGSWSHDLTQVDIHLKNTGVDLLMYSKHNEWEILSAKGSREVEIDSSSKAEYAKGVLKLHLRRNALFYMINYALPSVIIAVLSLLVFLIPPEVGKRMEAGINLLLCLSVYLMLVNSKMPITSKSFPLLTKFYGCTIVILVISLCCSCWVYSFYFVNPSGWDVYRIPKWLQVGLFDYLYPILYWSACSKSSVKVEPISQESAEVIDLENIHPEGTSDVQSEQNGQQDNKALNENLRKEELINVEEQSENNFENSSKNPKRFHNLAAIETQGKGKAHKSLLNRIEIDVNTMAGTDDTQRTDKSDDNQDHIKSNDVATLNDAEPAQPSLSTTQDPHLLYIADSAQMDHQKRLNKEKWKSAAMILNRFFMILLIISITCSFLACFLSSPRVNSNL